MLCFALQNKCSQMKLNSMACAHEILLNPAADLSVTNACWRTSDDHSSPGVDETDDVVAWHVLRNAMNSLFLGEILPMTDWDTFRVSDKSAYMHAVARVLSGGPVYISGSIAFDEEFESAAFKLIQMLVTSDGRILICLDPGRPTADCVFGGPRPGRMFKGFNRTLCLASSVYSILAAERPVMHYEKITVPVMSRISDEVLGLDSYQLSLVLVGVAPSVMVVTLRNKRERCGRWRLR